jgi:hypothetical protein
MGLATSADDAVLLEGRCSHRYGRRRPVPETGFSPVATRWIEDRTGWSIRRFVRTARRYRTIEIQAGNHTITAADQLPDDLRTAVAAITQGAY